MLLTPDERRALLVIAAILGLGLLAHLVAPGPMPPLPDADSTLVVLAAQNDSIGSEAGENHPIGLLEEGGVWINAASVEGITEVPGIGPVLGERIIIERDRNGPFRSIHDLTRVRGIGWKTAQRLEPYLSFRVFESTDTMAQVNGHQVAGRADPLMDRSGISTDPELR